MRIHSFTPSTLVNGPGDRAMIHFQGCTLVCPGCFNTSTHSKSGGQIMTTSEVINLIPESAEGVTISGGEPFLQPQDLLSLVTQLRAKKIDSIVVFSGFYLREIQAMRYGKEVLTHIDVLIDGRFNDQNLAEEGIRGSNNQTIHLLTERHCLSEFQNRDIELIFDTDGTMQLTGFPNLKLRDALDQRL